MDWENGTLGRSVLCECGQRNDLAVFSFGEEKLCLACGRALPDWEATYVEESFGTEVPVGAFGDEAEEDKTGPVLTGFESPSLTESSKAEGTAPPSVPEARVWNDGIREEAATEEVDQCAKCSRTFRGEWDRNKTAAGVVCHLCAVQADTSYQQPTPGEQRDLYRPAPPKKVEVQSTGESEERERKKRGLIVLAVVGTITVLGVAVFPVDTWVASFFAADMERARELPVAWHWVVVILGLITHALGQGVGLYVTLAMTDLLHKDDQRQNILSVAYLAVVFVVLNKALQWGLDNFGVFGIMAGVLIIFAVFVSFTIKLLLIAGQFHLSLERGIGFVMVYFVCSLLLGPGMRMVERLIYGIVAGIVL